MNNETQSLDWISGVLDGRSDADVASHNLHNDRRSQREAAMIAGIRSTLRKRSDVLRGTVPVTVERSIRMAIAAEAQRSTAPSLAVRVLGAVRNTFSRPALAGAMVAAMAIVMVALVLFDRSSALPSNLTEAALAVHAQATSGSDAVEHRSSDRNDLRSFFSDHGVDFDVFFPTVAAKLIGGSVRTINGHPYPVLVYASQSHTISLLEVDQKSIDSKSVQMDRVAADDVAESKWHWASAEDKTLFVWKSNSIMCSVVSDLAVDEVSALFRLEAL
ncbi:MAG: hypothetical protein FGM32_01720 [Candidatus Kapabacteria bacterium]|nr:hypothetical protein [Candidatus Kapabacteria bacterium]